MRRGVKAQGPDVVGDAHRHLEGAHLGGLAQGAGKPAPGQVVRLRQAAALRQNHHAVAVGFRLRAFEPAGFGQGADPHLAGVQEIAGALDVHRTPRQILRRRRLGGRDFPRAKLLEDVVVFLQGGGVV